MLEVQREQLQQLVALQQEQLEHARSERAEHMDRAQYILSRWGDAFPRFAEHCKRAYPMMERAYLQLLANMVEELAEQDDGLDNDFAVQEFVDRYAMRVGQFQHLLGIIGPIAQAAHQEVEEPRTQ